MKTEARKILDKNDNKSYQVEKIGKSLKGSTKVYREIDVYRMLNEAIEERESPQDPEATLLLNEKTIANAIEAIGQVLPMAKRYELADQKQFGTGEVPNDSLLRFASINTAIYWLEELKKLNLA